MLIRTVLHVPASDIDCAFKLFRRAALEKAGLPSASGAMVSAEILAKLRRAGYDWEQVPVSHYPRRSGRSTGGNPKVILRAFAELARMRRGLREPREEQGP